MDVTGDIMSMGIYNEEYDRVRYDKDAYDCATISKDRLAMNDSSDFRELVAMALSARIEIWFDVFKDDHDMCYRFVKELRRRELCNDKYI